MMCPVHPSGADQVAPAACRSHTPDMSVPVAELDRTRHVAAEPLTKRSAAQLVIAGLVLWLALSAIGITLWRALGTSGIVASDQAVSRWFAARRTPLLDTLTHYGTLLAETITAIALTVVIVLVFRWWLGRWRESIAAL